VRAEHVNSIRTNGIIAQLPARQDRLRCRPDHLEHFRGETFSRGRSGLLTLNWTEYLRYPVCLTCQQNAILKRDEGSG